MELILFAMISLVVIVALLASRLNDNSFPFPFDKKNAIFTPAEKNFHTLLEQAVGSQYRVLNRVKLGDIITIRKGVSKRATQSAINNANSKYLDFVVCDRNTMALCGVIDLVDTKGGGYKVRKDWFVSGALEASSIPHVRIKVKNNYSLEEIKACIDSRLLNKVTIAPKIKGRTIPAPLVKARPRNSGVVSPAAIGEPKLPANKSGLMSRLKPPQEQPAALPH